MQTNPAPTVADLAEATPATRDRYVDFLRAFSIIVVVFGHWLMAVVALRRGRIDGTNLLGIVPGLWIATWVLQIMPVFFFVGGFSNSVTLDALERRGGSYVEFIQSRTARLLKPICVFLGAWAGFAIVLELAGVPATSLRSATHFVTQPLWFIAVYIGIVALAPVMLRLHRRFGVGVLPALAAGAALVDFVRFGQGTYAVGALNLLFVWLFAHQLGFFYADGRLSALTRRTLVGLAAAGLFGLVLLTQVGSYPGSMVGMPGASVSNMFPPTICILALTVWQVAAAMLLRPVLSRWLQRPHVWQGVIALNGVIMTVFCWHLTALVGALLLLSPLHFPQPAAGSAAWWLLRPLWFGVLLLLLAVLVAAWSRFERPRARADESVRGSSALAALGVACVVVAIGGFAMTGLAPLTAGSKLIVFKVTPLANGVLLVLGQVCLWGASRTQFSGRNASSTCCAAAVGVTSPAATLASRPGTRAATSASARSDSTSVSDTSDHIHCRA
jgi:fucose 4-O-acetylase-like acetyltransferase